jgi:Domain of unknown function (DUF1707)/Cell wall-active antibiotics response 4TMS YvqF
MTGPAGGVRASDSDRDAAAEALAEAVGAGRLSLEEHGARLDAVYRAQSAGQVAAVVADLPSLPVKRSALYRAVDPYKIIAIGGTVQRAGRFRIGRFCTLSVLFGRIDLDLRTVMLSQDQVTVSVRSLFGSVTVIVPKAWRIEEQVLVVGSRQAIASRDNDDPRVPMIRLRGFMFGGSFRLSDG